MNHLPGTPGTYIEPFLGGGAVFFAVRPVRALLSDRNRELIDAYAEIRDNVEAVIKGLRKLRITRREFGRMRAWQTRNRTTQTVRFIYLNRTAFNGVYRVNRHGAFNVPFGCKPGTILCDSELLRAASAALQGCRLVSSDFEPIVDGARSEDVIYADPPYTVMHDNNGFRRYNESIFSWEDQVRLARALERAVKRGVRVLVSNAHHKEVANLYRGCFEARLVSRSSLISASVDGRGRVSEYLFMSR